MTRHFNSNHLIVSANFLFIFGRKEKQIIKKFSIIDKLSFVHDNYGAFWSTYATQFPLIGHFLAME